MKVLHCRPQVSGAQQVLLLVFLREAQHICSKHADGAPDAHSTAKDAARIDSALRDMIETVEGWEE